MRIHQASCVLAVAIAAIGCGDNLKAKPIELVLDPADATLMVSEAGESKTFTIALATRPLGEVTIALTSNDVSEGTVSPATVVFTRENFATPITVTVTGVDDTIVDGEQAFTIAIDGGSSGLTGEVSAKNADNDSAGITVTETIQMSSESGFTGAFTVVLNTEPTSDVTLNMASSDEGEGIPDLATLVFTPLNWNAPQTVFVSGIDDPIADGPITYSILIDPAVSSDAAYNNVDPRDPTFVNVDNDSPGVTVTPIAGLETTEGEATAEFEVVLTSQPTADVVLDVESSDPGEGVAAPAQLVFTSQNWNAPQKVTVTGVDDALDDGDQSFTIVTEPFASTDPGYAGIDPPDVAVTNIDDEAPGFTITPSSGLVTTEAGGTASFTIALISAPTADVTVPLATNDGTEGIPMQSSVTFTTADWDVPKTITVTGLNDDVADGNQPYRILVGPVTSVDPAYDGFDPEDVALTNTDNDSPGITVTPTQGLLVSELGDTDFFEVVLNSEPTASVTLTVASTDTTEGTVAPTSITFTPMNWDEPQRITVTGVNDNIADGNQSFTIATNAATSTDPRYNGINPQNVTVTNFDDDGAQVVIVSPAILIVSEDQTTDTFTIVLTNPPTANVTCAFVSRNTAEGTVSPSSVVFTPANYDQPRTITVTGVDDAIVDGNQLFLIQTNACSSTDPQYANANPRDIPARNDDNDP